MRFLFAHGVGRAAERALRAAGHDVLSIADVDAHAPDEEILRRAVAEDRVLVTTDLDFGELAVRGRECLRRSGFQKESWLRR